MCFVMTCSTKAGSGDDGKSGRAITISSPESIVGYRTGSLIVSPTLNPSVVGPAMWLLSLCWLLVQGDTGGDGSTRRALASGECLECMGGRVFSGVKVDRIDVEGDMRCFGGELKSSSDLVSGGDIRDEIDGNCDMVDGSW